MFGLRDITDARLRDLIGNMTVSKAGLVIGTASGFKITNTVNYCINGIMYSKTTADNIAMSVLSGGASQPAGTTRYYTVYLDAAGTPVTRLNDFTGSIGTLFDGPAPQSGGTTHPAGQWPSGQYKAPALGNNTITAITQAFPAQVTAASHGLQTGDTVMFTGIAAGSMQQLNGVVASIAKIDANNFTLDGVDSTQFQAFSVINSVGGSFALQSHGLSEIGIIKIVNATNPFIPGTTPLNAVGVTATYFDCAMTPTNPRPS